MLIVVDTNIIVSGLLTKGVCRKILIALKNSEFRLINSMILFSELKFVLERKKFSPLIDREEKEDILSFIQSQSLFVTPKTKLNICRDAKDNKILETALDKANFIVTGDKDLLSIESFQIPIITPKKFLECLTKKLVD